MRRPGDVKRPPRGGRVAARLTMYEQQRGITDSAGAATQGKAKTTRKSKRRAARKQATKKR